MGDHCFVVYGSNLMFVLFQSTQQSDKVFYRQYTVYSPILRMDYFNIVNLLFKCNPLAWLPFQWHCKYTIGIIVYYSHTM